ncbi:MAG: heme-binding protein [Dehalococcoidia bacterium]|nr:heme-binding protein [Dehalococcoidia bacterium]
MYAKNMLGLEDADKIIDAIVAHTHAENGVPISVAVVDYRGDLIKFISMDGVSWNSKRMAQVKAYSAAKFRRDTSKVHDWMAGNRIQLTDWADAGVTSLSGGVCIFDEESTPRSVLGAVAVSGWPDPTVDEQYAKVGIAAMRR